MKQIFSALVLIQALSCSTKKTPIVDQIFVDSLITHWSNPAAASLNEKEIAFWRGRIDERRPGMVNEQKYASTLRTRFQMFGNIADLRNADSILLAVDERFRKTESSISLNLVSYSISLHQFKRAGEFLEHARLTGARKYSLLLASFDVYFELGQYDSAARVLKMINDDKDYNYLFRLSKLEHLYGNTDSAIICMLKAAENAGEDITQMQVALSNAADLCLHSGDVEKANSLYMKCIRLNGTDFHSMMGLGWISWVNDHADSAAEKIFSFVRSKTQSPEALYKLTQLEASKANPESAKKYADEFIVSVENPAYGNMYNKYLIDLYCDITNEPIKAEAIASREISNRATAQTYAWLARSLMANNKTGEAYAAYHDHISGKPLEGLELFWMGKLMDHMNKGYDAQEFYKAAFKNRFDFPLYILNDLKKNKD